MKKHKRLLGYLVAASMTVSIPFNVVAADTKSLTTTSEQPAPPNTQNSPGELRTMPNFLSVKGTIKEIQNFYETDENGTEMISNDKKFIVVESNDIGEVVLTIDNQTYFVNDTNIAVGSSIVGYYNAKLPMMMIYPPQHKALVVAVDLPREHSIFVDHFDENLLSENNELKLNVSTNTDIVSYDGTSHTGELDNNNLVVIYSVTTRSIPPQTTPSKIIVLPKDILHPELNTALEENTPTTNEIVEDLPNENTTIFIPDVPTEVSISSLTDFANAKVIVNGQQLNTDPPYDNNGVIMVPVRGVAEALGYEASWNSETRTVNLGHAISFSIGIDSYNFARMVPVQLGTAPALLENKAYVPLEFFQKVMRISDIYTHENQIIINND